MKLTGICLAVLVASMCSEALARGFQCDGKEFKSGNFLMKCVKSKSGYGFKTEITACNPNGMRISVGQNKIVGDYKYICENHGKGRVGLRTEPVFKHKKNDKGHGKAHSCDGKEYEHGAFLMRCVKEKWGWRTEIAACNPEGVRIPVGQTKKVGNKKYKCIDKGNGKVGMKTYFS